MWKKGMGEEVEVEGRWGRSLRTGRGVSRVFSEEKSVIAYQFRESSGQFVLC
jgi:hypothetical protein